MLDDKLKRRAERTMVAICAHLVMQHGRDANFALWCAALSEVLPLCQDAALELADIRFYARELVDSRSARDRDRVMFRLCRAVKSYFAHAAATHLDAARELQRQVRIAE